MTGGAGTAGSRCVGCGRIVGGEAGAAGAGEACPTGGRCRGHYEPPRYCPRCGRRLRVVVIPTGWTATCRDHGLVEAPALG